MYILSDRQLIILSNKRNYLRSKNDFPFCMYRYICIQYTYMSKLRSDVKLL